MSAPIGEGTTPSLPETPALDALRAGLSFQQEVLLLMSLLGREAACLWPSPALDRATKQVEACDPEARGRLIESLRADLVTRPLVCQPHPDWEAKVAASMPARARRADRNPEVPGRTHRPGWRSHRAVLSGRHERLSRPEFGGLAAHPLPVRAWVARQVATELAREVIGRASARSRLVYLNLLGGVLGATPSRPSETPPAMKESTLDTVQPVFERAVRSGRDAVHVLDRLTSALLAIALSGSWSVEANAILRSQPTGGAARLSRYLSAPDNASADLARCLRHRFALGLREGADGVPRPSEVSS